MATIQRINIIGSREGSRNRRRLKANQTGKKFRVGIKSNISTNRNNLISGVDRCIHLNAMKKTTITKALMFLTLMRPSLVLFLVLWLKLVKDFLKVRCRLALLPFLISCLIWLDLVASLPLIKERILVIILLLHFLSLMLGSVLVLMLPLLVWLTPDLRIKK